jgi:hypothetical protein
MPDESLCDRFHSIMSLNRAGVDGKGTRSLTHKDIETRAFKYEVRYV